MQAHVIIIVLMQYYWCISSYYIEEKSKSILNVICEPNKTLEESMASYPQGMSVTTILFEFCPPPAVSLAHSLAERNIRVSAVRKLIVRAQGDRIIASSEFQGLEDMEELSVSVLRPQAFDMEVQEPRGNLHFRALKVLALSGFRLPPLPATSEFTKITLKSGTSSGEFGGCRCLEELVLRKWDISPTPDHWLAECQELRVLSIEYSTPDNVERILHGIRNVTHLTMTNCELYVLPKGVENLINLEKLDLSHNNIGYNNPQAIRFKFYKMATLKELILDYNHLSYCVGLYTKPAIYPALANLSLAHNPALDLCNKFCRVRGVLKFSMPSLKRFNAAYTSTSRLCFGNSSLGAVEYINYANTEVTFLEFKDFSLRTATGQTADFRGNNIKGVSLQEAEYKILPSGMTVEGVNITVECDCQHAWLARAMRNKRLSIGAWCSKNTSLADWPVDQLECDRYQCDACICRRAWRDNVTIARCNGKLRALPRLEGVQEIHAPGNLITAIGATELPRSLAFLDLSSNHISRISAAEAAALFAGGSRTVRLAGNPFICDCAALPLLQALRIHRTQVQDYGEIACMGDQRVVSKIDLDEMCADQHGDMWLIGVPLMGVLALTSVLAAVYFRYEQEIKMFLLVHGCCVGCMREDGSEDDRPYDAFVSFSHLDDEFVSEHLLPGLEIERRYRICVHYRDWVVGEWISTQISQSIELSRKVVIVLSKNFLASTWALVEFRLAQMRSLNEGRNITIVVIIDDVLEDASMSAEIRGYLAMTTYVKWEDPWFWKKLTSALPRKVYNGVDESETSV